MPIGRSKYTYDKMKEVHQKEGKQNFTIAEVSRLTGRAIRTESQYLRELHIQGLLKRFSEDKHYVFQFA